MEQREEFDFEGLARRAAGQYRERARLYEDFAEEVRDILSICMDGDGIAVHSIVPRGKSVESFQRKAGEVSEDDPNSPKYADPLTEITDLAGVRVITYFLSTVQAADVVIEREFDVREKSNRTELLEKEEKLGYQSIHYLVTLSESRLGLSEYARFRNLLCEIQVRTILQHAWAEIEHDIQYKSVETLPSTIRRRFMTLAGLVEIADREFQAIQDEDARLRAETSRSVEEGRLEEVEITPHGVKAYLDSKLGPDGRMSDTSYWWAARLLTRLGFTNFEQIDRAVSDLDDDRISRLLWGSRQGQLSRFEGLLLASMGDVYIERHQFGVQQNGWWRAMVTRQKAALERSGLQVGSFDPREELEGSEEDPGPVT